MHAALTRLLACLSESTQLADAFLIDLDLGKESGYEILRIRHSKPKLARIPAVVWTRLDEHHRELCVIFDIKEFMNKEDGVGALKSALRKMLPSVQFRKGDAPLP